MSWSHPLVPILTPSLLTPWGAQELNNSGPAPCFVLCSKYLLSLIHSPYQQWFSGGQAEFYTKPPTSWDAVSLHQALPVTVPCIIFFFSFSLYADIFQTDVACMPVILSKCKMFFFRNISPDTRAQGFGMAIKQSEPVFNTSHLKRVPDVFATVWKESWDGKNPTKFKTELKLKTQFMYDRLEHCVKILREVCGNCALWTNKTWISKILTLKLSLLFLFFENLWTCPSIQLRTEGSSIPRGPPLPPVSFITTCWADFVSLVTQWELPLSSGVAHSLLTEQLVLTVVSEQSSCRQRQDVHYTHIHSIVLSLSCMPLTTLSSCKSQLLSTLRQLLIG